MIRVIPSADRYHMDAGWLDARWHFSFGDYHDPKNLHFSALRVFNDDVIRGGGGFDLHPHKEMEIVTVVLAGTLRHKDVLGNNATLSPGEVQVMSAGTGIAHAEFNDSKTEPVHLMQLWILPRNKGNTPRWEQQAFDPAGQVNRLQALVSDGSRAGTLAIDQDATIYRSKLEVGRSVSLPAAGRSVYVFVIDGSVAINGTTLAQGDQGRIQDEAQLTITTADGADVLVIDLP